MVPRYRFSYDYYDFFSLLVQFFLPTLSFANFKHFFPRLLRQQWEFEACAKGQREKKVPWALREIFHLHKSEFNLNRNRAGFMRFFFFILHQCSSTETKYLLTLYPAPLTFHVASSCCKFF